MLSSWPTGLDRLVPLLSKIGYFPRPPKACKNIIQTVTGNTDRKTAREDYRNLILI